VSGPSHRRRRAPRVARFEPCEPRLLLTAQPVADFWIDDLGSDVYRQAFENQAFDEPALALLDAHTQTGLDRARAEYGLTGVGQTVAVIDTGIAYDHVALGGGFGSHYRVVGGYDFSSERDADPYDDGPYGAHGTHVAGIIGSNDGDHTGVAPGVDLVALRVFDDDGFGTFQAVEEALRWVHNNRFSFENPITTVNISLGTDWNSDTLPGWAKLEEELAQLEADGIFTAVAAGNDFTSYNEAGLSYPAVSSHVVAVGSVDPDGSLSYYSQRAARMIAAPGRSIQSTVPDYVGNRNGLDDDFARYSGTSMASPYVAGASALLREAYAFAGMENVDQQAIYDTMVNTADTVYDAATGQSYYRLNLDAALDAVMPDDEFGSTAAEAHRLGTIVDTYSIGGAINGLDDADWFQFTAGVTGTVTFTVDYDGEMSPQWQGAAAAAGQSELTFDVVAGQSYSLGLATTDGLGHYTLDVDVEAAQTAIDLGTISQRRFEDYAVTGDGQRFTITAAADGILTVEALFAHAAGDVDIALYDAEGRLVGTSEGTGDNERIDVDAAAGQAFTIEVYVYGGGTNGDVDLRVTNLVKLDGSAVTVQGTAGDDLFAFDASTRGLSINGVDYQFRSVVVDQVAFDGRGGSDTATLTGTTGSDRATVRHDAAELRGSGYRAETIGVEQITVLSGGGSDAVVFYDSAGDDTFYASSRVAGMLGNGFESRAEGFTEVTAYATAGGADVAKLFDSAGDDTFTANPDRSRLTGRGYSVSVSYFYAVHAYATAGGSDVAELFDSAGRDVLRATPTESALYGYGFYTRAKGFETVQAYATAGGVDTALLYDSAGDDHLTIGGVDAAMSGLGFYNRASGFERVFSASVAGGFDTVTLDDTAGNDYFGADGSLARWFTDGLSAWLHRFSRIRALSDSGGHDRAEAAAAVDFVFELDGRWDR